MKKRGEYLFIEKNCDVYTLSITTELDDDIVTVGFVEYTDAENCSRIGFSVGW